MVPPAHDRPAPAAPRAPQPPPISRSDPGRRRRRSARGIVEVAQFGSNPGKLRMLLHAPPAGPPAGAPLILLLHGCGQEASSFARDAGWIALADRLGMPLLLPEQRPANNRGVLLQLVPARRYQARAGGGAVGAADGGRGLRRGSRAIRERVFVAGLSAGGAMAAALLCAYPDVFAGGAVLAGLPAGAASNAWEALRCMAQAPFPPDPEFWLARARAAAPARFAGRWPRSFDLAWARRITSCIPAMPPVWPRNGRRCTASRSTPPRRTHRCRACAA